MLEKENPHDPRDAARQPNHSFQEQQQDSPHEPSQSAEMPEIGDLLPKLTAPFSRPEGSLKSYKEQSEFLIQIKMQEEGSPSTQGLGSQDCQHDYIIELSHLAQSS